jgi:N12 class adenine-specific DNA methylase
MSYNQSEKLKGNIDAIRIALEWDKSQDLTSEQIHQLSKYSGFGGLKQILFPEGTKDSWKELGATENDLRLHESMMELHALLKKYLSPIEYKFTIESLKNSTLSAFYTPQVIPDTLYKALKEIGFEPKRIYDPSAGAGIFLSSAIASFPDLTHLEAVEKDFVTGAILQCLSSGWEVKSNVQILPFEETGHNDDGTYDLVVSNIPFGNFQVSDTSVKNPALKKTIHNYFFTRGLDKVCEGGVMAFLTTDGFLKSPGNKEAREHLFNHADFISLTVMPDNLMKDSANTEAPSHLLIVQKNSQKQKLSTEEVLLTNTVVQSNEYGVYDENAYLDRVGGLLIGDEVVAGKNQYGTAHQRVWQRGDINQVGLYLSDVLLQDLSLRFKTSLDNRIRPTDTLDIQGPTLKLTFKEVPSIPSKPLTVQLGLFDTFSPEQITRSQAYIDERDEKIVLTKSARFMAVLSTADKPDHESIVLLAAKHKRSKRYIYRMFSNVAEINSKGRWLNADDISTEIKKLSEALRGFDHQYIYEGDKDIEKILNLNPLPSEIFKGLQGFHQEGVLVLHQGLIGYLEQVDHSSDNAVFQPWKDQKDVEFYTAYINLRDHYITFSDKVSNQEENESEREQINTLYDSFVLDHQQLNSRTNLRLLRKDIVHGNMLVSSMERRDGNGYVKSDILTGSLKRSEEVFITDNPVEALARSLNDRGKIDLTYLSTMTNKNVSEVINQLGTHIYLNPENNEWETRDKYLSGNVVLKLENAAQKLAEDPGNIQYRRSVEAITEVQPEQIPFELLDFNLGERWIPLAYYDRFASDFFEQEVHIQYFSSTDIFKIESPERSIKISREFAVTPKSGRTVRGNSLLEYALDNTYPYFSYEIPDGPGKVKRIPDNEAIQLAHQKIELIRNGFVNWLKDLPEEDKNSLADRYNKIFNCYVLREYNGDHQVFPGLDKEGLGIQDLYASQKNAAWRIVENRGALIDHEVGLGKTLTMIVASQEMKRLGIVHKPMIIALKANVEDIAATFRKAYPNARLLAPGKEDFSPVRRQRIFHEIKNNNWDCIILTHDQFGKIPQSQEIQSEIFQVERDNLVKDLETIKTLGGSISRSLLKGLEIRKNNLNAKLKTIEELIEKKQDLGIDFESMGVDHLFVDESHKFKNLTFTTRHDRVAGLGSMEGSQKALNLLFAVRSLQKRFNADLCVTFLSGTPISNSLTELYLIFKYLRPREMSRQGIENFDGWAAVFAKKSTDFEFSVTNEIVAKERFRHFIKVPELQMFYNEITDYKTAKHINLDKPELNEKLVNIPPTIQQEAFIPKLIAFAKTGNGELIGRAPLSESEDKGRMLIATNYSKKMATDMRLIDPEIYDDDVNNKVHVCARNVAEFYKKTDDHKGTQIIFCDIGTPKPEGFNLYDAIKDILVDELGIPEQEITFIHDWTDTKKALLFAKMNAGEIRVLMGSTEKAGTGLNVQRRIVAMHHIDIPWKPSELEQRNGRGARQHNIIAKNYYNNQVYNFIYATERSLDNYKFNLLKNKQTFISQMKNGELNVRTIDEGALDEKSGMNFAEYTAILSGDTSLLDKTRLEKKVAVMESLKVAHFRQIYRTKQDLESMEHKLSTAKGFHKDLYEDEQFYHERLKFENDGTKSNRLVLTNVDSNDPEKIGEYLIKIAKGWRADENRELKGKIGELYGFDLFIHRQPDARVESDDKEHWVNLFYVQREGSNIKYQTNNGYLNLENPKIAARHFLNAIDKVEGLKVRYEKEIGEYTAAIPKLKDMILKPFEKEQELTDMKLELTVLEKEIVTKLNSVKEHTKDLDQVPQEIIDIPGIHLIDVSTEDEKFSTRANSNENSHQLVGSWNKVSLTLAENRQYLFHDRPNASSVLNTLVEQGIIGEKKVAIEEKEERNISRESSRAFRRGRSR